MFVRGAPSMVEEAVGIYEKCFLQGLKPFPSKNLTPGLKPRPPKELEFFGKV